MFFGHGWLQHAGFEWNGAQRLRYLVYLVPRTPPIPDALAFAYGDSLRKKPGSSNANSKTAWSPVESSPHISAERNSRDSVNVDNEDVGYNILQNDCWFFVFF